MIRYDGGTVVCDVDEDIVARICGDEQEVNDATNV